MHYYYFNIADYRKDTLHLSPMEHYIYRMLLDWHYLDEAPIPKDTQKILRYLRLGNDCLTDVEQVLNDFFTEREEGYTQDRVLFEINEYRVKKANASKAGKASAKARKVNGGAGSERALNKCATTVQPTKNQEPRTNNQSDGAAAPARKKFKPPTTEDVGDYLAERGNRTIDPDRFIDYYQTQGWKLANGRPMADWKAAVRTWIQREETNHAQIRPGGNSAANGRDQGTRSRTIEDDLRDTSWAN